MEEKITHEINLTDGYTDARKVAHKHIVFGKSVSARRLLQLRVDPQSTIQTQFQDLLLAESIVEFGTLTMPVPLTTLLQLSDIDREDLRAGRDEFRQKVFGDRKIQIRDDGVTLVFGIKIGELRYTKIEFGTRLTGRDEVDADKAGATEVLARKAFLAGRTVTKLSTPEGIEVAGPVSFDTLNSDDVDEDELFALVSASELWRQSFRVRGRSIPEVGAGADDSLAGNEDELARGKAAADATGAA